MRHEVGTEWALESRLAISEDIFAPIRCETGPFPRAGNTVDQNRLNSCRAGPIGLRCELDRRAKTEIPADPN